MKTNTVPVAIFFSVLFNGSGIYAVVPIGELGCSFETDLCNWYNVSSDWKRYQYSHQQSHSTGPEKAKDGAFYVHTTEISDTDNATIASLESEPFHTDTTLSGYICFKFWYHMFGKHVKNLTVSVGDSQKFVKSGDQSQVWHCGVINVTGLSGKIKFNAYRTDSNEPYSIIALDYFQIVNSDTCSQHNCESLEASSTIGPGTTSLASTTSSTTEKVSTQIPPSGGVIELLPIAIGVPCGVLIVGAIIVGVCIHKRKNQRSL